VLSSARKAPAKAKRKAKPVKVPGKSIEGIDLSSDTETEDNKEYQDVLIMNEEERRHYFGGDHDSDTSEDPEEDPFAAIIALHEELQNGDFVESTKNECSINDNSSGIIVIDIVCTSAECFNSMEFTKTILLGAVTQESVYKKVIHLIITLPEN